MRSTWLVCVLLLTLSAAVFFQGERPATGQPAQKPKQAWAYKVMDVVQIQQYDGKGKPSLEGGLKKLGAEGWELISIEPGVPSPKSVSEADKGVGDPTKMVHYARYAIYYFKQPAP